jgi:hypothetical protein
VLVRGCDGCPLWELRAGGPRHLLKPDVATQWAVDPRTAVLVTPNEIRWYPRGADVKLPGGRAYRGPDDSIWFVADGKRWRVAGQPALRPLGIPLSRVRPTTDSALATVPVTTTSRLPAHRLYNGALLRVPDSETSFWYLVAGRRRLVPDAATLASWGLDAADALTVPADVELPPLGTPLLLKDGAVVRDGGGIHWLVSGGRRRAFRSWALFYDYGYGSVPRQTPPAAAVARIPVGSNLP